MKSPVTVAGIVALCLSTEFVVAQEAGSDLEDQPTTTRQWEVTDAKPFEFEEVGMYRLLNTHYDFGMFFTTAELSGMEDGLVAENYADAIDTERWDRLDNFNRYDCKFLAATDLTGDVLHRIQFQHFGMDRQFRDIRISQTPYRDTPREGVRYRVVDTSTPEDATVVQIHQSLREDEFGVVPIMITASHNGKLVAMGIEQRWGDQKYGTVYFKEIQNLEEVDSWNDFYLSHSLDLSNDETVRAQCTWDDTYYLFNKGTRHVMTPWFDGKNKLGTSRLWGDTNRWHLDPSDGNLVYPRNRSAYAQNKLKENDMGTGCQYIDMVSSEPFTLYHSCGYLSISFLPVEKDPNYVVLRFDDFVKGNWGTRYCGEEINGMHDTDGKDQDNYTMWQLMRIFHDGFNRLAPIASTGSPR
eukprot:Selendium_serpulae@DN5874_c0_g1_i7.p1